jgi:hypothetical protein
VLDVAEADLSSQGRSLTPLSKLRPRRG